MRIDRGTIGVLALIAAAVSFSVFAIFARYLHETFGVFHQLWIRVLIGSMVGLALPAGRKSLQSFARLPLKSAAIVVAAGLLIYPLGALCWVAAVQRAPIATVSFLNALPTEALWGALLFRDRLTAATIFFVALAVLGLWLLTSPTGMGLGVGETLALASSLSFSLGVMLVGRCRIGLSPMESFVMPAIFGAVMVGLLASSWGGPIPHQCTLLEAAALAGGGILVVMTFMLLNFGIARTSGALAGTTLALEVPLTALAGYLVYGERLALEALAGGALILIAAVGLAIFQSMKLSPSAAESARGRPGT